MQVDALQLHCIVQFVIASMFYSQLQALVSACFPAG